MSKVNLPEILRGCEVGDTQTVGIMQVIPLISEMHDEQFVSPVGNSQVSNRGYGHLRVENESDKTMIMPSHVAYVTKQKAQDHALTGAGFVQKKGTADFNRAKCVQEHQGGYIERGPHAVRILPFPLREKAMGESKSGEFSSMWPHLQKFNKELGCYTSNDGAIVDYFSHYEKQLDEFVAEFEPVPNQVGAIILVNGTVVGIERTPSATYWVDVWEPLVRDCYGALSIIEERRQKGALPPPPTRVAMREATSLDDLETALDEALAAENEHARGVVRTLLDQEFSRQNKDETLGNFEIDTLEAPNFVGQCIRDGDAVKYASIVCTEKWKKNANWYQANKFTL